MHEVYVQFKDSGHGNDKRKLVAPGTLPAFFTFQPLVLHGLGLSCAMSTHVVSYSDRHAGSLSFALQNLWL